MSHSQAQGPCKLKLNQFIKKVSHPEEVSLQMLDRRGLFKSQLSYGDLQILKGRKVDKLEKILKEGKILNEEFLNAGVNETSILTFEKEIRGIWKPHTKKFESNYRTEVLAYELDRVFGFHIVPITIERIYKNIKGSIQIFKKSDPMANLKDGELDKQRIFDWLINSKDRHDNNFLVSPEGKVISIDNGVSLTGRYLDDENHFGAIQKEINIFINKKQGRKIVKNIKNQLNDKNFKKEVIDYIGKEDAEALLERMHFFVLYSDHFNSKKDLSRIVKNIMNDSRIKNSDLALITELIDTSDLELDEFNEILKLILNHPKAKDSALAYSLKLIRSLEKPFSGQLKIINYLLASQKLSDHSMSEILSVIDLHHKGDFNLLEQIESIVYKKDATHKSLIVATKLLDSNHIKPFKKKELLLSIINHEKTHDKAISEAIESLRENGYKDVFFASKIRKIIKHPNTRENTLHELLEVIKWVPLDMSTKRSLTFEILNSDYSKTYVLKSVITKLNDFEFSIKEIEEILRFIVYHDLASNFSYEAILEYILKSSIKLEDIDEMIFHILFEALPEKKTYEKILEFLENYSYEYPNKENPIKKLNHLKETMFFSNWST